MKAAMQTVEANRTENSATVACFSYDLALDTASQACLTPSKDFTRGSSTIRPSIVPVRLRASKAPSLFTLCLLNEACS